MTHFKLAIKGGAPTRNDLFPAYNTIGSEEKEAVLRVLESGVLSRFLGAWHADFYGGTEVQALEKAWAQYFGVKHAISVNSATSGLYAAVGAAGIEPGDEVIVSPYTMIASATAAVVWGGIPIFADIESDYYCLDVDSIEAKITPRTKAIVVVDIFGQAYNAPAINALAKKHGLLVIEDCAQAPGGKLGDQFSGTLGDIGIYSLNYHKHIHSGEGGIIVTNDDRLAERCRLIRNHAEAVVGPKGESEIHNMVGQNYRMTEIEAAIGLCQLKKLEPLVNERIENVSYVAQELAKIPCLRPDGPRPGSKHAYYIQTLKYDETVSGIPRSVFVNAVKAELKPSRIREGDGPLIGMGYVKPIYLAPMFQQKIAFGKKGWPWIGSGHPGVEYTKGLCPVTERMHERELVTHELMRPGMTRKDLDDVINAFAKVWEYRQELL